MSFEWNVPQQQYAIFLPGRGYYNGFSRGVYDHANHSAVEDLDDAEKMLESCQQAYRNMSAPEIGDTAIIVERTVSLSATEWQPIEAPVAKLPPHQ